MAMVCRIWPLGLDIDTCAQDYLLIVPSKDDQHTGNNHGSFSN